MVIESFAGYKVEELEDLIKINIPLVCSSLNIGICIGSLLGGYFRPDAFIGVPPEVVKVSNDIVYLSDRYLANRNNWSLFWILFASLVALISLKRGQKGGSQ